MPTKHTIQEGECVSSIAYEYGLFPSTIWEYQENSELRKLRKDPNVLFPGDVLVIPDKKEKQVEAETGKRHRFQRKGVSEQLRIRFVDDEGKPKKGIPYILDMKTKGGRPVPLIKNKTDSDGYLDETIPPDAFEGEIALGEGEEMELIPIMIGYLDPIDTISGIKARLNNLGYLCDEEKNGLDEMTRKAIREFQEDNKLKLIADDATEIDKDTQKKIDELYSK